MGFGRQAGIDHAFGLYRKSHVRDLGGRVGLEVNGSTGTANRMEVYALGRHLATYSNGTTYLSHSDLLGTERVRSNGSGGTAESYRNLPFGDFMQPSGNGVSPMHFTGQERDPETGLDHFLFRYYNSTQGHWMTPDPAGLAAVDPTNPQSLNRYAYVMNRPTVLVDPLGKNATNPGYCDAWNQSCGGGTTWDGDLVHSGGGGGGFGSGFSDTVYGNMFTPGALAQYLAMVAQAFAEARKNASDAANKDGCPANQKRFFANPPLYQGIADQANTDVDFIMALSAQESGWNGPHSQKLHNLFGTTHAGGRNLSYKSYQASADAWVNSYASWVNGASTIDQFVDKLLDHVPPYNANLYGDYRTAIVGGQFKNPALNGATTIGTYQSVLNYEGVCGVTP